MSVELQLFFCTVEVGDARSSLESMNQRMGSMNQGKNNRPEFRVNAKDTHRTQLMHGGACDSEHPVAR